MHRVSRAHQYLFARLNRAHPGWSVLSNEFTKDSFPCRYYDNSPHLQLYKVRIQDKLPSEPLHARVMVFEKSISTLNNPLQSCRVLDEARDQMQS